MHGLEMQRLSRRRAVMLVATVTGVIPLVAACGGSGAAPAAPSQPTAAGASGAAPTPASAAATAAPAPTTAPATAPTTAPAAAATSAPATSGKPAASFTWWNDLGGANAKAMADLLAKFDKEQGVKVDQQIMDINDLYSKLKLAVPAGQAPDLMLLLTPAIPNFASLNLLEPYDPAVLSAKGIKQEDYAQATWDAGTYKGKRYALTQDVVQSVLF